MNFTLDSLNPFNIFVSQNQNAFSLRLILRIRGKLSKIRLSKWLNLLWDKLRWVRFSRPTNDFASNISNSFFLKLSFFKFFRSENMFSSSRFSRLFSRSRCFRLMRFMNCLLSNDSILLLHKSRYLSCFKFDENAS